MVITLLISGCSVNYDLNIDNDIEEKITLFTSEPTDENVSVFIDEDGFNENGDRIDGIHYYDLEKNVDSKIYSYKFNFKDYKKSTAVNTCLKGVSLNKSGNNYLLSTTGYNSCFDTFKNLDKININVYLSDKYDLIDSNADFKNDKVLKWEVTRDNYKDKIVNIHFKENNKDIIKKQEKEDKKHLRKIIMLIISFIIVIVGIFFIKAKKI